MNIYKENLDFLIYDSIRTKEFIQKMKKEEITIAEIMRDYNGSKKVRGADHTKSY